MVVEHSSGMVRPMQAGGQDHSKLSSTDDGFTFLAPSRSRAGAYGRAVRRWLSSLGDGGHRRAQRDLIIALNDVASAVSTQLSLDDVLETIVERAKSITNTDKAALILTLDHSDKLDEDTLVVRGSREEHLEEWWSKQLRDSAPDLFETGRVYLDLNRDNDAWLMCAPIRIKNTPVGLLAAINSRTRRFTPEQEDFLAILGAFAATAIENARLAEQGKYVLLASERDRIAREMHDGISQSLFSVALGLEVCKKMIVRDPRAVSERLDELQQMVDVSRSELRRFIYDLRPVKLQELGLVGAIEYWVQEVTRDHGVVGDVSVMGERRTLTPAAEACLYRVAKEAVSNVVKHAGATAFQVEIAYEPETVALAIADDGCGFDTSSSPDTSSESGIGLRSIQQRIRHEGGSLAVVSSPGQGTRIAVRVPHRSS